MKLAKLTPPGTPINGALELPGSKSITNRALILASLAKENSLLLGISPSDDSRVLIDALSKVGVSFGHDSSDLEVRPPAEGLKPYRGTIDIGLAGTSFRFLLSLLSFIDGAQVILTGANRLKERPISDLVDALRGIGAEIEYLETPNFAPLLIKGKRLSGNLDILLNSKVSSQFLSSLLLASPLLGTELTIKVSSLTSEPYVALTLDLMRKFGLRPRFENESYRIDAGRPLGRELRIEGDISGATYFWAMAALTAGEVSVSNLDPNSPQPDRAFLSVLSDIGCEVSSPNPNSIKVRGPQTLRPIAVDMKSMPDSAQGLAVLLASVQGESTLTGLETLKVKETDRLQALQNELFKLGVSSEISRDSIKILGRSDLKPAQIKTYKDHRMAMAFSILGAKFNQIVIEDPDVVSKSVPNFWRLLEDLKIGVQCA